MGMIKIKMKDFKLDKNKKIIKLYKWLNLVWKSWVIYSHNSPKNDIFIYINTIIYLLDLTYILLFQLYNIHFSNHI